MDLGNLGQTFAANKGPILGTAAAGVAGFALWQKHKAAGAPAGQGVQTDTSYSAGDQTAGMLGANAYDSSASDVYGLVQPQLESLGSQLTDLQNKLDAVPVSTQPVSKPTPVTKPKPTPAPAHAAPRPSPVPVPAARHAVDSWVTVNAGDTLSGIAAKYPQADITWQSIYNANRSTIGGNPNLIHPGQRLHVVG